LSDSRCIPASECAVCPLASPPQPDRASALPQDHGRLLGPARRPPLCQQSWRLSKSTIPTRGS